MQSILPVYNTFDITLVKGDGVYLYDDRGQRYLDFYSGYGVCAFGHSHPHLVKALHEQADKVWHISNMFNHPLRQKLADRLVEKTFADTVFFQNSGVEAWELGTKMVRRYFWERGEKQRNRMIVIDGCFHGRTIAAISTSNRPYMSDGFGPLLDGFDRVPFGDLDALEAAIGPNTACIHLEPVMGEGGGMKVHSPEYLQAVRALCDKHGMLLYLDEIQCGMGRTGKMFAHEWAGITPDVVCVAKALGGGFPIGATLATERVASAMAAGTHGSTYPGNPLAMAVSNAALDLLFADGFFDHVHEMGLYLAEQLQKLAAAFPKIYTEVRGQGLMRGIKCHDHILNRDVIEVMHQHHLLSIPGGENTVRTLPPLIITKAQIDEGIAIMHKASEKFMERLK
jgi:acetylornithine/N-succinyldiaminopimelate aminotransferase